MKKNISELTNEEIAKAFPVELFSYSDEWPAIFEAEKILISNALGNALIRIEHFGSTSIPGITAKDTIDILADINPDEQLHEAVVESMKTIGYDFMWQLDGAPDYRVFPKGFITGNKEQTFIIHSAGQDHKLWDRLYFRDYLREHPEVATEYEALKKELAMKHKYDRVGYRIAKTDFVVEVTNKAQEYYAK